MNTELENEILEIGDAMHDDTQGSLPAFLNVLTILTFIGSGLALLSVIYSFLTLDQQLENTRDAMRLLNDMPQNGFGRSMLESSLAILEHAPLLNTISIIVTICCIVGAILMRKLKKNGYYLYLIASILGIIVPLIFVGFGIIGFAIIIGNIFTLAFIIMYSVNLKHLK